MKVSIQNARLAFANIWHAKTVNGEGDPAYSATLILDPEANALDIKRLDAAIEAVARDKWSSKADSVLKAIRAKGHVCLRDGDDKSEYDGFEGKQYVSTRSKQRPTVVDRNKVALTEDDGRPYSGCFVNAIVEIWAQDNQFGKRINAQISGLQFVRDGDAFGGGQPASADEFDDLGEDDLEAQFG